MAASTPTPTLSVTAIRTPTSSSGFGMKSLSLLHDLPSEIIIHILECALRNDKPSDLALISRIIRHFVTVIIYRTVVLDTSPTITLFHRTAISPRSSPLLTHVKKLAITCGHESSTSPDTEHQIRRIISQCPAVHSLVVRSLWQIDIPPSVVPSRRHDGPSDLTIQSLEGILSTNSERPHFPAWFSASLTHLRICEPGNTWQSPLSAIAALNGAPNLTHLQLARRADSNKDNDVTFADEIAQLLSRRKSLKKVVVSVFEGPWKLTPVALRESRIWVLVSRLQEFDSRLVVVEGESGKWSEGWKDTKKFRCGGYSTEFWRTV
jgi:hypothetical protein